MDYIKNISIKKLNQMGMSPGCTMQAGKLQDSAFHLTSPPHCCFRQTRGSQYHPNQFFICDKLSSQFSIKCASRIYVMQIPSSNIHGDYHHE